MYMRVDGHLGFCEGWTLSVCAFGGWNGLQRGYTQATQWCSFYHIHVSVVLFVRARAVALMHFLHSRIPAKRKRVRTLPLAIPMQTQYALFFGNMKHTHTQNTKQCHAVRIQNIAEV